MILLKKAMKGVRYVLEIYFLSFFAILDYFRSDENFENSSVCGFFQCCRQTKAVIATIASFRKFYPTGQIYLYSDKGEDMSHISAHFNCMYEYLYDGGHGFWFQSKEEVISWMKRLLFTAQNFTEDFVMVIEEDVRIHKKVKKLKFDFNAIKPCQRLGKKATAFLRTKNSSIPNYIKNIYYGGFGGTLIRRTFIVDKFSNIENLTSAIDELLPYSIEEFKGKMPADAILTMLVFYFGGTVGMYGGFAEMSSPGLVGLRDNLIEMSHWKYYLWPFLGRIEVVHNDKSFYNLPLSEEERKIFLGE